MLRPREHYDDWFSLFVIHQNRVRHGQTNYIPEQFLDDFLDLVVWGHEHECLIEPAWNGTQNFYITQPGSTVATSLSDSETKPKHCALLFINRRNFKLRKLPLETVRPFYLEDVVLSESHINPGDPDVVRKVETFCAEKVSALLDKAERDRVGYPKRPDKPLIRLRVNYSGGFELFSTHRFGQKFVDRVANPKDIVLFHRRKLQEDNEQKSNNPDEVGIFESRIEALDSTRVEDMVREYFAKADEAKQLQVLTERGMSDAIKEFVDKEERDAISELANHQIKKTQVYLKKRNATEDTVEVEVQRYREERRKNVKQEDSEVREVMSRVRASRPADELRDDGDDDSGGVRPGDFDDDDNDDDARNVPFASPARGRGRGSRRPSRGRGESNRRGGRVRGGRGRASSSPAEAARGSTSRGSRTTRSIKDAFSAITSSSKRSAANYSSEEECTIIDDDDDATVSHPRGMMQNNSVAAAKRSRLDTSARSTQVTTGSSRYGPRMGVSFESGDSSEEEELDRSIPQRKRRR